MDVKRFDWLLDSLAKADSMLPDPEDREAAQILAEAFRDPERWKGSDAVRLLLVTGPEADPFVLQLEYLSNEIDEQHDRMRSVHDQLDEMLTEVRDRRKRITAERDAFRHAAQSLADSLDEVARGELGIDDIKQERLMVRALLSDPEATSG